MADDKAEVDALCTCEAYTIRTDYGTGVERDVDTSSCPIHTVDDDGEVATCHHHAAPHACHNGECASCAEQGLCSACYPTTRDDKGHPVNHRGAGWLA